MKLYINHNLEICANEQGWPEEPEYYTLGGVSSYNEALAQAKQESVPVENQTVLYPTINACTTPDTFIEFDGEFEFVKQHRASPTSTWFDYMGDHPAGPRCEQRTVARLKKAEKPQVSAVTGSGMYFPERQISDLRAQLSAAEKRCKELEEWKKGALLVMSPIIDYCQDSEHSERLGMRLGQSITKRVLEILETYNQP